MLDGVVAVVDMVCFRWSRRRVTVEEAMVGGGLELELWQRWYCVAEVGLEMIELLFLLLLCEGFEAGRVLI